jgi:hypothetical protein
LVSLEVQSVRFVAFSIYSSHCIHRRRMRTCLHNAFTVHVRYDVLYGAYKATPASVQGVGVDF